MPRWSELPDKPRRCVQRHVRRPIRRWGVRPKAPNRPGGTTVALVVLGRKDLPSGMVEVTLSDGYVRATITVTPETERSPEASALYEVMFNKEQERLSTARRVSQPGGPY